MKVTVRVVSEGQRKVYVLPFFPIFIPVLERHFTLTKDMVIQTVVEASFYCPKRALLMAAMGNIFSFLSPGSFLRCRTNHLGLYSFQQTLDSPLSFSSFTAITHVNPCQSLLCWISVRTWSFVFPASSLSLCSQK